MSAEEPNLKLPFGKWIVDAGLYQPFRISAVEARILSTNLLNLGLRLDVYCPACRNSSVFSWTSPPEPLLLARIKMSGSGSNELLDWLSDLRELTFTCARVDSHKFRVILNITRRWKPAEFVFSKIGQLPSTLDLLRGDLQKYSKVASADDLRELNSSAMCNSHGFHVAAFVYLRRIFERRLVLAHEAAKSNPEWNERDYDARRLRMDERIKALKNHLPNFLVQNRKLYGILSKGVHELSEKECQEGHAAVNLAIVLILDEEIERRERAEKLAGAKRSLEKLSRKYEGE
jgi:hypothetical protein